MKFLKTLTQKKLAKAVVCGLMVSGSMFVGMNQAYAGGDTTAWVSGTDESFKGTAGTEVRITAEEHDGARPYTGGKTVYGNMSGVGKVTIAGGTVQEITAGWGAGSTLNIIGLGGELNGLKNDGEIIINSRTLGGPYGMHNLNVTGIGTVIKGMISDFANLNFILPAGEIKGKDMLVLEDPVRTTLTKVNTINVSAANGVKLSVGDTVNLIHKTTASPLDFYAAGSSDSSIFDPDTGKIKPDYASVVVMQSPLKATSGEVTMKALDGNEAGGDPNDLVFTALENISVDDPKAPEGLADNAKSHVETRANAAALLNEGADFMMEQGMASAKAAAKEGAKDGGRDMAPFVAVGAGSMRYKTGSHVDSKSWHAGVGVSKQVGDMMYGIAVEHGKSNYDSYVNSAHGEGKSQSTGGTVFAEMKKESGVHYDAAIRAGRVKNDYNANLMGFHSSYDESSTYYGMSIGGGKEFAVSDKDAVDVYGRYYWAHTNSSDVTTNLGDKLGFDAINSHRTRLGSRYTHTVNDMSKVYAGLAWQYEFSGETKATINGSSAPAPGLKGHSGMLELGWKVEAAKNMAIDLNMSGWTGKQRGVMGGVNMQWKF